jgi:hypothetical protein
MGNDGGDQGDGKAKVGEFLYFKRYGRRYQREHA